MPAFVFELEADLDDLAQQLVAKALLPLLRRMQGDKGHRWNLQLLNVGVVNMVPGAADDGTGAGRDIGVMFREQDQVLLLWRAGRIPDGKTTAEEADMSPAWDSAAQHPSCLTCGRLVPQFAMAAHARYHELGD